MQLLQVTVRALYRQLHISKNRSSAVLMDSSLILRCVFVTMLKIQSVQLNASNKKIDFQSLIFLKVIMECNKTMLQEKSNACL